MRILFIINTPAQAYTWQHIIRELQVKEHTIKIIARDYGSTPEILRYNGFQIVTFKPIGRRFLRLLGVISHFQKCYELSRGFSPSHIVGFGLDAAVVATIFRKPCIIFNDDEPTHFRNYLTRILGATIITPDNFRTKLGKKHVVVNSYKEMAYLHPNYFQPDISIFDDLKIKKSDKYIILRFNGFDAIHDIGKHGFSFSDKLNLVKELEKYAHVFISPEGELADELIKYKLSIPYNRIHHALYYAQLLVTDTQTMATEAATLGTPAIRCNNFVGPNDLPNFIELEHKYELIYSYRKYHQVIQKAMELIKQPDLKEKWAQKRQNLLADKIDLTKFIVGFIENYSVSIK